MTTNELEQIKAALALALRNDESRLYMLPADANWLDRGIFKASIATYTDALKTLETAPELTQGDVIPGRPDAIIATVITADDIRNVAEENGWTLTDEQAQAMLVENASRISDDVTTDWNDALWASLENKIEKRGTKRAPERDDDDEAEPMSFEEYWDAVEAAMLRLYGIGCDDSTDPEQVAHAQEAGDTPDEYARYLGAKFDLTPLSRKSTELN